MADFITQDDLAAVRELLQILTSNGLSEISVTSADGATITVMTRAAAVPAEMPVGYAAAMLATYAGEPPAAAPQLAAAASPPPQPPAAENRSPLPSPMVGTFFASASPDDPPFVVPGDIITVGQTIGLIEAMKVFSEIPSDVSGRVVEIPVASGDLVQLGQPLLYVAGASDQRFG